MFELISSQQRWFQQAFPDSLRYFIITLGLWPDFSVLPSGEAPGKEETLRSLLAFRHRGAQIPLNVCLHVVGPQCRGGSTQDRHSSLGTVFSLHVYEPPSHSFKMCISVLVRYLSANWRKPGTSTWRPPSLQGQPTPVWGSELKEMLNPRVCC